MLTSSSTAPSDACSPRKDRGCSVFECLMGSGEHAVQFQQLVDSTKKCVGLCACACVMRMKNELQNLYYKWYNGGVDPIIGELSSAIVHDAPIVILLSQRVNLVFR